MKKPHCADIYYVEISKFQKLMIFHKNIRHSSLFQISSFWTLRFSSYTTIGRWIFKITDVFAIKLDIVMVRQHETFSLITIYDSIEKPEPSHFLFPSRDDSLLRKNKVYQEGDHSKWSWKNVNLQSTPFPRISSTGLVVILKRIDAPKGQATNKINFQWTM